VTEADALADRRSVEAKRIADLEHALKERDDSAVLMDSCTVARQRYEAALQALESAWASRFHDAATREPDLVRLKRLIAERRELLETARTLREHAGEVSRQRAELTPLLDLLADAERQVGVPSEAQSTLTARVEHVKRAVTQHNDNHAELARLTTELAAKELRASEARASVARLEQELSAWRESWVTAMDALRLAPDATPERAVAVARQWSTAQGVNEVISQTEKTLKRMDADEEKLRELVAGLTGALSEALPSDGVAAAKILAERLDSARAESAKRRTLEKQRATRLAELTRRTAELRSVESCVQELCAAACCSEDALTSTAQRHAKYRERTERQRQLLETLRSAGDGVPLEQLREQWEGHDPDAREAEVKRLEHEEKSRGARLEEAAVRLRDKQTLLETQEGEQGFIQLVTERERLVAELHLHAERYLEVELARAMIDQAVERVRLEQQAPLIKRASELFARATSPRSSALSVRLMD